MNENLLEFDKVLLDCADFADSVPAKNTIANFRPFKNEELLNAELDRTDEAFLIVCKFGSPRFGELYDVPEILVRAKNEAVLSLKDLIYIKMLLNRINELLVFKGRCFSEINNLYNYFRELIPEKELLADISRSVISEEELSDDASEELSRIRKAKNFKSQKIREDLTALTTGEKSKFLRENVVTMRDGRFVVPVKSEHKNEIRGLIHDTSRGGKSLFVEPIETVGANNELRILEAEERAEIHRIMKSFSERIKNCSENIASNYYNSMKLEVVFAKANYAAKIKASRPIITDKLTINLKKAHHPLLLNTLKVVVPIDVNISDGKVFVITGPNTGGKTAVLKTVGLLSHIALSGMLIPANDNSEIPFLSGGIFVDIGDSQNLEQSLSTFSGHLLNIKNILDRVNTASAQGLKTLVLFDEPGTGTDPKEGAAIAVSLLEEFLKISGTLVFAATHYDEVKEFAIREERVINAACGFDRETLLPTYKLIVGLPGKSDAFAIARRLGLPENIISNAESSISESDKKLDLIISKLKEKEYELLKKIDEAEEKNKQAEALKITLEKATADFEKKKERQLSDIKSRAARLTEEIRKDGYSLIDELKEEIYAGTAFNNRNTGGNYSKRLERLLERGADKLLDKAFINEEQPKDVQKSGSTDKRGIKVGDGVYIVDIKKQGVLLSNRNGKCEVSCGNMKIRTKITNLRFDESALFKETVPEKVDWAAKHREASYSIPIQSNLKRRGEKASTTPSYKQGVGSPWSDNRPNIVDVHGMFSEDALAAVDKFIDDCILNGISSGSIVHGKGEGILRKVVDKFLRGHNFIDSHRLGEFGEGGSGVTIFKLKS